MRRLLKWTLLGLLTVLLGGVAVISLVYWRLAPELPPVAALREVQLQVPLRVLSADGKLIASFGEMRRTPKSIDEIPVLVRQAFVAVEDERFYDHPGIDLLGISRAALEYVQRGGEYGSGGSTITQQVARNFFLSPEKRLERKIKEIFLALKIERVLSKDEILALYLNKIFLGQRAYGVAAAAQVYYGKALEELSVAEAAMLAALPQAPSRRNPVSDPDGATTRRNLVLGRMLTNGFIDQATHDAAVAEVDRARVHVPPIELSAPYVAELARIEAEQILGRDVLDRGYVVYTTVRSIDQEAANRGLTQALLNYDRRHGWRGAEGRIALDDGPEAAWLSQLRTALPLPGMEVALVLQSSAEHAELLLADGNRGRLSLAAVRWARRHLDADRIGPAPTRVSDVLSPGDVIRVSAGEDGLQLTQAPKAEAAFVALDPEDGAVRAMTGGFSFGRSSFNRATQSNRPPGSSFKPFIYSAALERGYTPASIINDAPLVFTDGKQVWAPDNDNSKFGGPTRLREALVTSRNLVSVRVLDDIGVRFARRHIERMGFPAASLHPNLSLALGTNAAPPVLMAQGYAIFANGGFLVHPYLVARIVDAQGKEVHVADPPRACRGCPQRLELDMRFVEQQQRERAAEAALAEADSSGEELTAVSLLAPVADAGPVLDPVDRGQPTRIDGVHLAARAISEQNAYLISSMLLDVVQRGTGRAAATALGRNDLGGKTGTTNDFRDAWFSGIAPGLAASAWVGFDDFSPLGNGEFGGRAALPIWIEFMRVALEGVPPTPLQQPVGITTARISRHNGLLTSPGDPSAIEEVFRAEDLDRLGTTTGVESTTTADPFDVF
ncbi:MAG: PBP1A family penicillin-binding protein [Xanthomonadales bacterium]|jgi:penicillin-binding protein 1A|nr:PBP1A family penicillin-binding protein [Xanthomonadales bacterium]